MILIVVMLAIVSVALSLFSLRGVLNNSNEVTRAKKDLAKNRVIYQNDSALSKE